MKFSIKYNSILNKKNRDNVRRTIIATFGITYATFLRWANGVTIPPKRYQSTIAEIMGTEVSELFPTENNHSEVTFKN
ncbi:MAG: hypothetical protein II937_16945 [Bacteroidales bacterium]|nr:hypothetical protein [Bacteroidales bacterium]